MMHLRTALDRFKKLLLITIGLICFGLGIVGYVLPGLPGTIFLIIAATLFVRSSDRLYKLVVNNHLFGRQVGEYLRTGAMPLRAKTISLVSIWVFSLISIFVTPYTWLFKAPILILAIVGTLYILSRPTSNKSA
ncbi:uncharacterized protein METZ01_LOCUS190457 [marine metagenome]|uniref:DUF454 domain-containing protein n=1 Tax=marine metagenome TaxID=408172 RepID=A0A382DJ03_9ZZZZ